MINRKITIYCTYLLCVMYPFYVLAAPDYRFVSDRALTKVEEKYDYQAKQRVKQWVTLLNKLAEQRPNDDTYHIHQVNDFFNQVEWLWDIDHWGQEDYWATPIETLATNGGDCEDFSIGKYFSLTSVGMQSSKLRITYVKARVLNRDLAHMVLAYYPTPAAEPLILDNINKNILPASQRPDLTPIYSFNVEGLWLAKARKRSVSGDISRQLPSWGSLKSKMDNELR